VTETRVRVGSTPEHRGIMAPRHPSSENTVYVPFDFHITGGRCGSGRSASMSNGLFDGLSQCALGSKSRPLSSVSGTSLFMRLYRYTPKAKMCPHSIPPENVYKLSSFLICTLIAPLLGSLAVLKASMASLMLKRCVTSLSMLMTPFSTSRMALGQVLL